MVFSLVVITVLDTLLAQLAGQVLLFLARLAVPPLAHNIKHSLLANLVLLTEGRVMEDLEDVVDNLINVLAAVFPSIDDAWNDKSNAILGDLAGDWVEDVGKVILRQHRVGWIMAVVVVEDEVLALLGGCKNTGRSSLEFFLGLSENWCDEWCKEGKDVDLKGTGEVFDDGGGEWNLVDSLMDGLEDLVVELEDGVDVLCGLCRLLSHLLNLWVGILVLRNVCLLLDFLCGGVGLKVVGLSGKVGVRLAEERPWDLVEDFLQAGVGLLVGVGFVQLGVEDLDFGLEHFVGNLTDDRVKEISHSKGTSNKRIDLLALDVLLGVVTDMWKHIDTHLDESELNIVGVSRVVLDTMESSSKKSERFVQISTASFLSVLPTELDTFLELFPYQTSRSVDALAFGSNVDLHAILLIDREFLCLIDRSTKA